MHRHLPRTTQTVRPRRRVAARWALAAATLGAAIAPLVPTAAAAERVAERASGLAPVAECVIVNGDGTFTAFFGYENTTGRTVDVPAGRRNRVQGARATVPTSFATGRHVAVVTGTTSTSRIRWRLNGTDAVATARSQPCSTNPSVPEAPAAALMMLAPAVLTGWWLRRRATPRPC